MRKKRLHQVLIFIACISISNCQKNEQSVNTITDFEPILSESLLDDWAANPDHWRFEDGVLTGETTPAKILIKHSFFTWKKEPVQNFELKVEYRISERGNSGINYRSEILDEESFVMRGYQADIDGANEYTGQLYEDKGRAFLARRNQIAYISPNNKIHEIALIGEDQNLLSVLNENDWNEYHIIAHGNTFIHRINGQIMSITIDDGSKSTKTGFLGFQLHLGPPMKVEFRNLLYKKLP